jgi:hypothetical protein
LGDRNHVQGRQERQRLATDAATVPVALSNALGRRTSRTAQVLLGSAVAALAVPTAIRSAETLPAVESESASPGLGHRGLLGHEPYGSMRAAVGPMRENMVVLRLAYPTAGRFQLSVRVGEQRSGASVGPRRRGPGRRASDSRFERAMVRDVGEACSRSAPSSRATIALVRSFSTNSRPALRAAASGGRPRPATTRREAGWPHRSLTLERQRSRGDHVVLVGPPY